MSCLDTTQKNEVGRREKRARSGFTLVEIMIVVAIIGVLATIAVPSFARSRRRARVAATVHAIKVFEDAFSRYNLENGVYPVRQWPDMWWEFEEFPDPLDGYLKQRDWTRGAPCDGDYSYTSWALGFAQGGEPMKYLYPLRIRNSSREVLEAVAKELCGDDWTNDYRRHKAWFSGNDLCVTLFYTVGSASAKQQEWM